MEQILALILAAAVLAAIPGPNVAFIIAVSLRHGFRHGAMIVAGTTLGLAIQLSLVVLGLTAVLALAANVMIWIKWLGVAYLLYLGLKSWCSLGDESDDPKMSSSTASASAFWQGVGVALVNPKTLMFNAAFLSQFVPAESTPAEVAPVALIYLAVLFSVDLLWAATAARARGILPRFKWLHSKLSGGFLFGAGIGLALARVQR